MRLNKRKLRLVALFLVIDAVIIGGFYIRHLIQYRAGQPYRGLYARQKHMNALALATISYANDHNMVLPDANKWQEELYPYLSNQDRHPDPKIAMNRALSQQSLETMGNPFSAILFFESTQGPVADLNAIPIQSPTGMFAIVFANAVGYPRICSSRNDLIEASKKAIGPIERSETPANGIAPGNL